MDLEGKTLIEIKHLTKKYGNFVAVDDISFTVKDHEVVGFLGPNGAGKSTTMNMITGFIEPTKGRVIVNGFDISRNPIKAKRQIGYMPEGTPLYKDLTVKEFVSYMADLKRVKRKNRKEEVKKVLEETGLTDVQNKLIRNVSRGYKQRVSMAGALVGNPDVLILDEPTVGLDPKQIAEIRALIKQLGKNHTVILSSHILSEVSRICERVVIINHGKILAVDTPENLEKSTKKENSILVTVEDKKNNMKDIKTKLKGVNEITKIKNNEDGTVQYKISANKNVDIRKKVFDVLPKNDISIFELKKNENTLEDAFLTIVNTKDNEIKNEKNAKIKEEEERKVELSKMNKKERKEAIKEDKKKEKQEKKDEFNKEWEKDIEIAKEEKEYDKQKKLENKEKKRSAKIQKSSEKDAKKLNSKKAKTESKVSNNKTEKKEIKNNSNVVKVKADNSTKSTSTNNKSKNNSDNKTNKSNASSKKENINKNSSTNKNKVTTLSANRVVSKNKTTTTNKSTKSNNTKKNASTKVNNVKTTTKTTKKGGNK